MSVKRYAVWDDEMFEEKHALNSKNGMVHLMVKHEDFAALEQRLIESERYGRQTDITIDNLEMKLAQMAAENAGLKNAFGPGDAVLNFLTIALRHTTYDQIDLDDVTLAFRMSLPETPATDDFMAEVRAQGVKSLSNAVQSVISERQRQQSVEGWTPEHDDQYGEYQLLWASSCYVLNTIQPFNRIPMDWPWAPEWWKPTNPRRDLVKAGALILAEIERIDRQEAAQ